VAPAQDILEKLMADSEQLLGSFLEMRGVTLE